MSSLLLPKCPMCKRYLASPHPRDFNECECRFNVTQALRFLQVTLNSFLALKGRYFIPLPDGETPYLERLVLDEQSDGSKTYLHVIYASDGDRDPHDHPWDFESTIVYGEYVESSYARSCRGKGPTAHRLFSTLEDVKSCPECSGPLFADQIRQKGIYGPGDKNVKKAHQLHSLKLLTGPIVTLVKRGPKVREWGFQTPDGWEHHKNYIARKFPDAQPTEVD